MLRKDEESELEPQSPSPGTTLPGAPGEVDTGHEHATMIDDESATIGRDPCQERSPAGVDCHAQPTTAKVTEASGSQGAGAPTEPTSEAAADDKQSTIARPMTATEVLCASCGRFSEFVRCRVLSKRAGTWRCNSCNSKCATLYRRLGQWPISGFAALGVEEQMEFFRGLDGLSAGEMVSKVQETLETFEEHTSEWTEGGKYLPLSVWSAKGYDTTAIADKSRPSDVLEDSILGRCYRLRIQSRTIVNTKGVRRASRAIREGVVEPARNKLGPPVGLGAHSRLAIADGAASGTPRSCKTRRMAESVQPSNSSKDSSSNSSKDDSDDSSSKSSKSSDSSSSSSPPAKRAGRKKRQRKGKKQSKKEKRKSSKKSKKEKKDLSGCPQTRDWANC